MSDYKDQRRTFMNAINEFSGDEQFMAAQSLLLSGSKTVSMNRKVIEKNIDTSWLTEIEKALPHIDNVIRNPRNTIKEVEEVVPIAMSKKITVESIKHLGQHTDFIQDVDKKTGRITPSKILNIHKEETYDTYENRFVNTLIDRLFIFISIRYQKLVQTAEAQEAYTLSYDTASDSGDGRKVNISFKIETIDSLSEGGSKDTDVWKRLEKVKTAIDGYKGSVLCTTLGNLFIRPPVMRTNAITKNVDLNACLTLWQFIESYDKAGYEVNVSDTAQKPDQNYIEDMQQLTAFNYMLFRSYTHSGVDPVELKTQKSKTLAPKVVKRFEKQTSNKYDVLVGDGEAAKKSNAPEILITPKEAGSIAAELNKIIDIEKQFLADEEQRKIEAEQAAAEAEKKRIEQEKIERARREEEERIRLEKEEEERRQQAILERQRADEEARKKAEEEERERREKEEQIKLEARRKRQKEERLRREEEERVRAERARIREEKRLVRSSLGSAMGEDIDFDDTEDIADNRFVEYESPEVAARKAKEAQQQRELERKERDRAERLKAERARLEQKDVKEIFREYSKNPYYIAKRGIRNVLANVFGVIPEGTDNPDYIKKLADKKAKEQEELEKKQVEREMEVLYEKYAPDFKYDVKRRINNAKFKRKKRLAKKNQPPRPYTPPQRTEEEQKAIDAEMKRLYREYHVSAVEKLKRFVKERKERYKMK
ncbi:DUF2357 domain-containing protein [Ruminococcus sp.]|uniref:DUF2357 domain-containing protein n=1 Tax=Ruminococcus sp. TaxID=41978 RepID=UPI0025D8F386|nr:DUF2357 domain-containing protein [Ruminococcus sp.]